MSQKIILATGNAGKVREMQAILAKTDFIICPQSDFSVPEAEETGMTFVENAIIKARNACEHTGLPAIADDSGIEVDFLNGDPGIYSSRFAGINASNEENNKKLLNLLKDVKKSERTARFQCILVYLKHANDPTPLICQGTWEGFITEAASGTQGFGYDPIFFVPDHQCTAAELPAGTKNQISHRGQALAKLMKAFAER